MSVLLGTSALAISWTIDIRTVMVEKLSLLNDRDEDLLLVPDVDTYPAPI